MTIKGISDKRRLNRVGKIRLGIKAKTSSGKDYPKAVDYFVCNEDESTTASAANIFKQVYGDKPTELQICFPNDKPEEFFQQYLKRYGKTKGLLCKGDGEKATAVNEETGEMNEIDCAYQECDYYVKKQCKECASLQFMMPAISGVAVWQIDTSSYNSIVNLNTAIDTIKELTRGRIAFIPLELILRKHKAHIKDKNGKDITKTVNVLDIAVEKLDIKKMLIAAQNTARAYGVLPEASSVIPDDLYTEEQLEANDGNVPESPRAAIVSQLNKMWDIIGTDQEKRDKILTKSTEELAELIPEVEKAAYEKADKNLTDLNDQMVADDSINYDDVPPIM